MNTQAGGVLFSVRGLKVRFPNNVEALHGIDLDVYEGEAVVIAGANGSGKTILTRVLAGLLEASEGEVLFRGRPLDECRDELRRSVGLVFQDADSQILGETVEEDIRFGPENLALDEREIGLRVEACLGAFGLEPKREFAARHLSGGEKRRLAVAGILAMGCRTVIMDEPFANLDWPGVRQALAVIGQLKESGKSLIILTHELEKTLAFADRLVILAGGRVRADGKSDAVLDGLDPAWGVRDPRRVYKSAADCSWL